MESIVFCSCLYNFTYSIFDPSLRPLGGKIYFQDSFIESLKIFKGNTEDSNFFTEIYTLPPYVLIGNKNKLHWLKVGTFEEFQGVTLEKGYDDRCKIPLQENLCYNYVTMIMKNSSNSIIICATNSLNPTCYNIWCNNPEVDIESCFDLSEPKEFSKDSVGYIKLPEDPNEGYIYKLHRGMLITAGASITTKGIIKRISRFGVKRPIKGKLNEMDPRTNFTFAFSYSRLVFFTFSELDVDTKSIQSRIGHVCIDDNGANPAKLDIREPKWTSFIKARLNCSIPGKFPFYFNEIASAFFLENRNIVTLFGVFNTPLNSIHGGALCAYEIQKITRALEVAKPSSDYNSFSCTNTSQSMESDDVKHIRSNPLTDKAVEMLTGKPLFTLTSYVHFTKIVVKYLEDNVCLIFIGSTSGKLYKLAFSNPVVKWIDEIQVLPVGTPITKLHIFEKNVLVVSREQIVRVPIQRCHSYTTCSQCMRSQDPSCQWNVIAKECQVTDVKQSAFGKSVSEYCKVTEEPSIPLEPSCSCSNKCKGCPAESPEASSSINSNTSGLTSTMPSLSKSNPQSDIASLLTDNPFVWIICVAGIFVGFTLGVCVVFITYRRRFSKEKAPQGPFFNQADGMTMQMNYQMDPDKDYSSIPSKNGSPISSPVHNCHGFNYNFNLTPTSLRAPMRVGIPEAPAVPPKRPYGRHPSQSSDESNRPLECELNPQYRAQLRRQYSDQPTFYPHDFCAHSLARSPHCCNGTPIHEHHDDAFDFCERKVSYPGTNNLLFA